MLGALVLRQASRRVARCVGWLLQRVSLWHIDSRRVEGGSLRLEQGDEALRIGVISGPAIPTELQLRGGYFLGRAVQTLKGDPPARKRRQPLLLEGLRL